MPSPLGFVKISDTSVRRTRCWDRRTRLTGLHHSTLRDHRPAKAPVIESGWGFRTLAATEVIPAPAGTHASESVAFCQAGTVAETLKVTHLPDHGSWPPSM